MVSVCLPLRAKDETLEPAVDGSTSSRSLDEGQSARARPGSIARKFHRDQGNPADAAPGSNDRSRQAHRGRRRRWLDRREETRLGLNGRNRDTDHDGIPDNRDPMPLFAMPSAQPGEDDRILQRALFAVFGLTGAPHALFIDSDSKRLHVESNAGPMLDGGAREGIRVGWRLVEKREAGRPSRCRTTKVRSRPVRSSQASNEKGPNGLW